MYVRCCTPLEQQGVKCLALGDEHGVAMRIPPQLHPLVQIWSLHWLHKNKVASTNEASKQQSTNHWVMSMWLRPLLIFSLWFSPKPRRFVCFLCVFFGIWLVKTQLFIFCSVPVKSACVGMLLDWQLLRSLSLLLFCFGLVPLVTQHITETWQCTKRHFEKEQ